MRTHFRLAVWLAGQLAAAAAHAEPVSLDDWFQGPRLVKVAMSPDAKSLAMILFDGEKSFVAVRGRDAGSVPKPIFATDPQQDIRPIACHWVSDKRLVCRFSGHTGKHGDGEWVNRLVAMDADGGHQRNLLTTGPQINGGTVDRNVNFNVTATRSDEPNTMVLTGWLPGSGGYGVAKLSADTGILRVIVKPQQPITVFQDDGAGNVLLAGGVPSTLTRDKRVSMFGRTSNQEEWKPLTRLASHADDPRVRLATVIPGTTSAYVLMTREGRSALFKIDLTDQKDPEPVYWHEQRDVAGLLVDSRATLLGVLFESNVLGPQYIDPRAAAINAALQKSNPNRWYWINDVSEDGKLFLIGTSSVSESSANYILDASSGSVRFEALGAEWPGLARHSLPPTRAVGIRTRTGAMKELLFTAPAPAGRKAPLVVFADGTQSTGGFEPATYFLASRGYAVLRPYFSGKEAEAYWQNRPYLDWNGGLYDELIDAVSWAAQRDDVDATRICIVGRNAYGGYQALLAAARPEGPFKCAASLEGLSDLEKPRKEVARASLIEDDRPTGTSDAQVALESPLRRAAEFRLPMLLVEDDTRTHSARDHEGGREMAAALAAAKKPHKLVLIDETGESYLRREYAELEKFLADNLR
jgi:dienelactone hydrolase